MTMVSGSDVKKQHIALHSVDTPDEAVTTEVCLNLTCLTKAQKVVVYGGGGL